MAVRVELHAIRPRKNQLWRIEDFQTAVDRAMISTATSIIKTFDMTTKTWKHKVKFKILRAKSKVGSRDAVLEVATDNAIYIMVNHGTEAHDIYPVEAAVLAWKSGFVSKTIPDTLVSRRTKTKKKNDRFAAHVHHPGTKARNFDQQIQKYHQNNDTLGKALTREFNAMFGG